MLQSSANAFRFGARAGALTQWGCAENERSVHRYPCTEVEHGFWRHQWAVAAQFAGGDDLETATAGKPNAARPDCYRGLRELVEVRAHTT